MKRFMILICFLVLVLSSCRKSPSEGDISADLQNEARMVQEETQKDVFVPSESEDYEETEDTELRNETEEIMYGDEMEDTVSNRTVIVMVEADTDEEKINTLCSEQDLIILYKYEIISGYAFSSEKELSEEEMTALIENLNQYSFVLGVERDTIIQLDDAE